MALYKFCIIIIIIIKATTYLHFGCYCILDLVYSFLSTFCYYRLTHENYTFRESFAATTASKVTRRVRSRHQLAMQSVKIDSHRHCLLLGSTMTSHISTNHQSSLTARPGQSRSAVVSPRMTGYGIVEPCNPPEYADWVTTGGDYVSMWRGGVELGDADVVVGSRTNARYGWRQRWHLSTEWQTDCMDGTWAGDHAVSRVDISSMIIRREFISLYWPIRVSHSFGWRPGQIPYWHPCSNYWQFVVDVLFMVTRAVAYRVYITC